MNELDLNKPLLQLTASEFLALVRQALMPESDEPVEEETQPCVTFDTTNPAKRFVYGIAGIARLLGCSKTTANRIKASGKIDAAITQCGRMIAVDADMALQLLNNETIK